MPSTSKILNVAVIGAGEIAMVAHLPNLLLMSHMFKTVALVDISKGALEHCSKKFHVGATYEDVGEMLKGSPEVDVVFIANANEYHVAHTVQCLRAGKHVLIEKPVSLTLGGYDEIEAARKESGKVCFVGYMRRYATAFLRVKEMVQALEGNIDYVRVRDIIGWNSMFVEQSGYFPGRFTDFPPHAASERSSLLSSMLETSLGKERASDPFYQRLWGIFGGLATHDFSAMREIFGMPRGVLAATKAPNAMFYNVVFEYPTFNLMFEMGIDNVMIFDAGIDVYAKDKHIKLKYETPYIKGLPVSLTVLSRQPNGDHSEEYIRPTYEDPYTLEYKALYDAIVNGTEIKNGPMDAKHDTELIHMIADALVPPPKA